MTSTFEVLETSREQPYASEVTIDPVPIYEPADAVWRLLTALLMVRKQEFPELAASFGLNPGAMHALLQLDPDEPQSMSSLAGAWKCDASNVTWLVDRLEEHGLAERRPHPTDRRVRSVALTRKGTRMRAQIESKLFEAPASLRNLSVHDLETLGRILRKLAPEPHTHP
jgi:DNA-binding MarR family transcriptional regulator